MLTLQDVYFAGTFKLTLEFAEDYPNKAPVVKIVSAMFHPNGASTNISCHLLDGLPAAASSLQIASVDDFSAVYADGGICLDILQNQWSPIYDVSAILTSIRVSIRLRI